MLLAAGGYSSGCGRANCFCKCANKSELSFLHEIACYHLSHGRTGSLNGGQPKRQALARNELKSGERRRRRRRRAIARPKNCLLSFQDQPGECTKPSVNSCNLDDSFVRITNWNRDKLSTTAIIIDRTGNSECMPRRRRWTGLERDWITYSKQSRKKLRW